MRGIHVFDTYAGGARGSARRYFFLHASRLTRKEGVHVHSTGLVAGLSHVWQIGSCSIGFEIAAISFIVVVLSGMNIYEPMTMWGPPVFLLPELQAMINP